MIISWIEETLKAFMIIFVFGLFIWYIAHQTLITNKVIERINERKEEIAVLTGRLDNVIAELQEIKNQFTVLTDLPEEKRKELVAYTLSEKLTSTDSELKELKDIMLQTPEKAIKLERFQAKQEASNEVIKSSMENLKEQVGFLQNLLQLMLGFLVAAVLYIWRQSHINKPHNNKI